MSIVVREKGLSQYNLNGFVRGRCRSVFYRGRTGGLFCHVTQIPVASMFVARGVGGRATSNSSEGVTAHAAAAVAVGGTEDAVDGAASHEAPHFRYAAPFVRAVPTCVFEESGSRVNRTASGSVRSLDNFAATLGNFYADRGSFAARGNFVAARGNFAVRGNFAARGSFAVRGSICVVIRVGCAVTNRSSSCASHRTTAEYLRCVEN